MKLPRSESFRWMLAGAASAAALVFLTNPWGTDRLDGDARLIGYEALPECTWIPPGTLMAAPLGETASASGRTTPVKDPLRMIRDPYAGFSSVAVDAIRNEVLATDENNFRILVYDRMDNTPPQAAMTEPKRIIAGSETEIEFQCGLYIDPATGDVYAVNNDTKDKLVIFSSGAEGNVPPTRFLETPHGTFGIAVDEPHQELFLTVQHDSAVVVYEKAASGDDPPIRMLQGRRTRLADPHGIAVDPKRDLIFVANYGSTHDVSPSLGPSSDLKPNWPLPRSFAVPGSGRILPPAITVHSRAASGDTPPLRVIEGPKTRMNWPTGLAFHSDRNELFVSNDMSNSILVFDGNASGDAAPIRVLQGPKTGIDNPTGVYLDLKNEELWVANFGNHSMTVYDLAADGDSPPKRTIRSSRTDQPSLMIGNPGAVAYDTKRKEILVPN